MTSRELAEKIKNSRKTTPVCAFMNVKEKIDFPSCKVYGDGNTLIIFGAWEDISPVISEKCGSIIDFTVEPSARKSALGMSDILSFDARIEYGAHVREGAELDKNSVIMHGAVVNSGAQIGEGTMIDMNAVIGSRAVIGKTVHIGAGAVIAGVLEPESAEPVYIGDNAFVGANAVVLEGIKVGANAVVGAGAVVTRDIPENAVAVGVPAKLIGTRDSVSQKLDITGDLRA